MTKYSFHDLRKKDPNKYFRLRWQEYKKTIDRSEYWKKRWQKGQKRGISGKNARRAKKYRENECKLCGSKENLCTHHIDGDQNNNSPKNIMTLCVPCHNFVHSLQGGHKSAERTETVHTKGGDDGLPS